MKKLPALLTALAMLLTLCACGGSAGPADTPAPAESPAAEETPAPAPADPEPPEAPEIEADLTQPLYQFASGVPADAPAGTVNGAPIASDLYFYQLHAGCSQLAQYGLTDFSDEALADYLRSDAESAVRYYAALYQLCADNGVEITDDVRAELDGQLSLSLSYQGTTREQFLRLTGLTEDSLNYLFSTSWLYESLLEATVPEPSRAELEAYGAENGVFTCKHILLKTVTEDQTAEDGTVTPAADYNAARKALAEELLARIQAEGDTAEELLDQLAAEYSEDPGLAAYPDGYTFDASSSLVGGFREGTLALSVGETGLVETDYGYHIILRLAPDLSGYADQWRDEQLGGRIEAAVESVDVQISDEVLSVDLTDFYLRAAAYQQAVSASFQDE